MTMELVSFFMLMLVPIALGYPEGQLAIKCDSMTPDHTTYLVESSSPPYRIRFPAGKTTYSENEPIEVTLEGKKGKMFKEFMIQARPDTNTYTTYGTIATPYPEGTDNPCNDMEEIVKNAALAHTARDLKESVTFTWIAPPTNVGDVVFVFTVGETNSTFWVKRTSSVLSYMPWRLIPPSSAAIRKKRGGDHGPKLEIKKDSKCGESIGCFHDCDRSGTCGFLLTYVENGDDIDFTLSCKGGGHNIYCAIGLSKDKKMGHDSVFECVANGNVSLYVSYNAGYDNYRLIKSSFGISNFAGSNTNGILKCAFSRKKTYALGKSRRKKRGYGPSATTFFDMNDDFYVLYAEGSTVKGAIKQHTVDPKMSSRVIDFQTSMDVEASALAKTLVKLHGVLMMLAWLCFARLGSYIAGQYKTVWPDGTEWVGQKPWFILHSIIMATTFLLTVVAFILIFVHVGGFSEILGDSFQKSHPIIGIITVGLVTINPIMGFFRPKPGTPKRPYFNIAHTGVGVAAWIFAVVNIFSAFGLAKADVPSNINIVLGAYLGWVVLFETAAYVQLCLQKKATTKESSNVVGSKIDEATTKESSNAIGSKIDEASNEEAYEMKSATKAGSRRTTQRVSKFRIVMLCLHGVAVVVCFIVASAIMWKGDSAKKPHGHDDDGGGGTNDGHVHQH